MLNCFSTETNTHPVPITLISKKDWVGWFARQVTSTKEWIESLQFCADAGQVCLLPHQDGKMASVLCGVADQPSLWDVAHLPFALPQGVYLLDALNEHSLFYAIGWGLGAYQFTRYKKANRLAAQLMITEVHLQKIQPMIESIHGVRDWINTPTEEMGPSEFAEVAKTLASHYGAKLTQIIGLELLKQNYTAIHTVGRASDDAPRLLDLRWGNPQHPKISLVGKGVCFDSGGLDLKPSSSMLLMKKDMAGGAHVLGLARMLMQAKLPIYLRVLIPLVENVIAGNAYRPGDVIKSRHGMTIEIGNTDAEGRVILADALYEAASEKPDLLIDISTLTGAARIALGTELPVVFSNNDQIVHALIQHGEQQADPMWRLPLYQPYRELIHSQIADISNHSADSYGGAITAALFLQAFVPDEVPWLHFDIMAWNLRARPGRPQGGEAMVLRALFSYLTMRYGMGGVTLFETKNTLL